MRSVAAAARAVRAAIAAGAAQVPARRRVAAALGAAILVVAVLLIPWPNAVRLRDWATSAGPWFPLTFFTAHVLVTVFPFPRTAFTLAAGLLFGPALGISLVVVASSISAVVALLLVRAAGWRLDRLAVHPRVTTLNLRLAERGWPTVLCMRLIPAVPFSVLNYAAGSSAVRVLPYTLATIVGLVPGTAAVVILGDALTGSVSPLLVLISVGTAVIGVVGLAWEVRAHRQRTGGHPEHTSEPE